MNLKILFLETRNLNYKCLVSGGDKTHSGLNQNKLTQWRNSGVYMARRSIKTSKTILIFSCHLNQLWWSVVTQQYLCQWTTELFTVDLLDKLRNKLLFLAEVIGLSKRKTRHCLQHYELFQIVRQFLKFNCHDYGKVGMADIRANKIKNRESAQISDSLTHLKAFYVPLVEPRIKE